MSDAPFRAPLLDLIYQSYLNNEDTARFVAGVSFHYTRPTLGRLVAAGSRMTRRAAALAIGFVGDIRSNAVLGRALRDVDRGVRMLAENGIRDLWCRDGTTFQRQWLRAIIRLNVCGQCSQAAREASRLILEADQFAEAWNQRAIAYFQLQRYSESVRDCRQAIRRNRYHFAAVVGMGHCYLEVFDGLAALECFRWALQINPEMENVRAQVDYLQRSLEEK